MSMPSSKSNSGACTPNLQPTSQPATLKKLLSARAQRSPELVSKASNIQNRSHDHLACFNKDV
eukprot:5818006-Amphidinium_carterae.1